MTEQKKKRVFSAGLAGGVMLVFILLAVLVYQLAGIITRKNQIKLLDAEIARLEQEIKETDDKIEALGKESIREQLLRELGLYYGTED